jgi:hypothetical protein
MFGQAITFTASVNPVSPATGVPTGTVTFLDGSTILGTAPVDASGNATLTAVLSLGSHSITAVYGADANYTGSTSVALAQTVGQAASAVSVTSSDNPAAPEETVTFAVLVQAVAPGAGTPSGMVTFQDGNSVLGTATLDASGRAVLSTSALLVGSHAITVTYEGDVNFTGSTSLVLTQVVSPALTATATALASSGTLSVYGQVVTLTATVTPFSGSVIPSGMVSFRDGSMVLGTATLDAQGRAVLATALLGVGSHRLTAVYLGDPSSFTGSTSPTLTQTVNRATTTTTIVSSNPSSVFGQSVSFTATVSPDAPGAGVPTGRVTFLDGATVLGAVTLDAQGRAILTTALLGVGNHTITAVYGGDGNFSGRNAIGLTQTVHRAGTSVTLVSDTNPATVGQAVTFTATVTPIAPGSGTPTGTVTFRDGDTVLGTVMIDSTGQAQLTLSTLTVGSHPITASYDGDFDFDLSVSSVLAQIIDM